MKKDYESLKICFIEWTASDILTTSFGNDNDAPDFTDWGNMDDWGE